jgi:solute carrier family 6 GABA transporter-like protein 1
MYPDPENPVGGFSIGFMTLPAAITEMPGSNFWAVMLFFTLMVLGYSSAFAMLDAVVTLIMDAQPKWNRILVVTGCVLISFAFSIPYCAEFGYYLLTGIDRWTNDVALVFVVWAECVCATTVYRWSDVKDQVGLSSFVSYNFAYYGAQIIGIIIAHTVGDWQGAVVAFSIYVGFSIISLLVAKTPDSKAPGFWGRNDFLEKFWFNAFYSVSSFVRLVVVIALTVQLGQPTEEGSQPHRRTRKELEDSRHLVAYSPICWCPSSSHCLQLLLSQLLPAPKRPTARPWIWCWPHRDPHRYWRPHRAQVV